MPADPAGPRDFPIDCEISEFKVILNLISTKIARSVFST